MKDILMILAFRRGLSTVFKSGIEELRNNDGTYSRPTFAWLDEPAVSTATFTTKTGSNDEFVKFSRIDREYFPMLYEMHAEFAEAVDGLIVETEERLAKRELFREKSSSYNRKCKNTMLARKRKRWNIANNLHRNSFQREGRR